MFRNKTKYQDDTRSFQKFSEALKTRDRATESEEGNEGNMSTFQVSAAAPAAPPVAAAPSEPVKTEPAISEIGTSVVSTGSAWHGSLKIDGSVRIDGQLSGEVEARDTVYVAETAEVDAKIRASFVIIAGRFQGEVHCGERFEVMPTGRVKCQITTKTLVVHEGAFVEGQVNMTKESPFQGKSTSDAKVQSGDKANNLTTLSTPAAKVGNGTH